MAAKKKPSAVSQIKALMAESAENKLHAEQLQKKLDTSESSRKYEQARLEAAQNELKSVHAFLDAVPNPPSRKTDPTVTGHYTAEDVGALTRLMVFLATRNAGREF